MPSQRASLAIIFAVPAAAALACILVYGVDVPLADAWDTPGILLQQASEGGLRLESFTAQHNEHRTVVPRLIFLGVSAVFGWHAKLFMVLNWACIALTAALAARLLFPAGPRRPFFVAAFAALLFSMAQFRNYLWGVQLVLLLPALCLAAALTLLHNKPPTWPRFAGAAAFALAGAYSCAHGMTLWLLAAPPIYAAALADPPDRRRLLRAAAAFAALAVIAAGLYAWGYHKPGHHPPLRVAWRHPRDALLFLASWIGAPITGSYGGLIAAPIVGGILLILAALAVVDLALRARRSDGRAVINDALPSLAFLGYALATGALIAVGRLGFGVIVAFSARYASFALWVPAALLGLLDARLRRRESSSVRARAVVFAGLIFTAVLAAVSWYRGLVRLPEHHRQQSQNLLTLRLIDAIPQNPLLERLHPAAEVVAPRMRRLIELGWLQTELAGTWITHFEDAARAPGRLELHRDNGALVIDGAARLPGDGRPADAALIVRDGRLWSALLPDAEGAFSDRIVGEGEGEILCVLADFRAKKLYVLDAPGLRGTAPQAATRALRVSRDRR